MDNIQRTFLHDGCVVATNNQGSPIFGMYAGLQCVPNSTCALLKSVKLCPSSWETRQLDEILQSGYTLYEKIGKPGLLLPTDIPRYLNFHGTNYNITEKKSHIGSFISPSEEFGLVTIGMLNSIFTKYHHFLLCLQDSTVAVIHAQNEFYYVFDPHSRNISGFPAVDGIAVLLCFMSLGNLQRYLSSLAVHLNADRFELTPFLIKADVQPSEMQKGFAEQGSKILIGVFADVGVSDYNMMERYFTEQLHYSSLKHQRKRKETEDAELQTEVSCNKKFKHDTNEYNEVQQEKISQMRHKSKEQQHKQPQRKEETPTTQGTIIKERNEMNRKEYMRLYMQKRRKTATGKEEHSKFMRQKRTDPKYKEKEDVLKHNKRSDSDYRQKEATHKQEKRSDAEYRQKEATYIQNKRCDPEYRQKEITHKQMKRSDPEYRQKETKHKQDKRCDPEYRQNEATHKQVKRSDPEYRQKEATYIQDKRCDPEYRQKEATHKQVKRSDPEYRQKEATYIQDKHSDLEYRQKEATHKQVKRCEQQYRQKEAMYMQNKRSDSEYRQKEATHKQVKRSDEEYRQKEASYMQDKRSDLEYRQKEATHKQVKHCDPEYKQKEASYMQDKRSDLEYRQKEATHKQVKRSDPEYKQKEASYMQDKRSDLEYRQKEATHKQVKRSDPEYRQKEATYMQDKRSDLEYRQKEATSKQVKCSDPEYRKKEARYMQGKRSNIDYKKSEYTQRKEASMKKDFGCNLEQSVTIFHNKTAKGCIFVCSSCHQTNFEDYVIPVHTLRTVVYRELLQNCLSGYTSVNEVEYICVACKKAIYKGQIPKLSLANKCGFPEKPIELELHALEEVIIAPIVPFMTIRQLPMGGQKSLKGNVCHVPVEVSPTVNSLPRTLQETQTVSVKLKRKKCYKTAVFSENVRPLQVVKALNYLLKNSELYSNENIHINDDWINTLSQSEQLSTDQAEMDFCDINDLDQETVVNDKETESDAEEFDETSANEITAPSTNTLLDDITTTSITFAPGEGKRPVFHNPFAEYLAFPTIYCGKVRPDDRPRKIQQRDIFKYELRSVDTRVASHIPNIFWKAKHKQIKQIMDKVTLAVRRNKTKGKKITASMLLDEQERNNIVKLDEGYYIFRTIRTSPAYFDSKKKDVMAMVRQLGIPTLFLSLSAADTKWENLLICLGKLLINKNFSQVDLDKLEWEDKCDLISKHPAACARFFNNRINKFFKHILQSPFSPFGKMEDFFYRVEFQHRGSPHIHALLWIRDSPKFDISSDEEVCSYIDQIITCSSKVSPDELEYLQFQKHRHSKSCRKIVGGHKVCRFGAPWPPMRKTQILRPLDAEHLLQAEQHKNLYSGIQEFLQKLGTDPCDTAFDEFLTQLGVNEDAYILALRSSLHKPKIFIKRNVNEIRINAYMKDLLHVWQANHDVQFVLDVYSLIVYVCDYMTKAKKGMSALLSQACEEAKAGNMTLKESVRHMGNKFLNAVETGEIECCYDLLELPITQSSVKIEFISTCNPDDRVFIAKHNELLQQLTPDSEDVKIANVIDKYAKRPSQLEEWCLADFVSELEIIKTNSETNRDDSENDMEANGQSDDDDGSDLDIEKQNGIFPIHLRNGILIKKRRKRKVIRFVNYKKKVDPENYCRERLLLYTPWRNEEFDLYHGKATYVDSFATQRHAIERKMKIYEPMAAILDTIEDEMDEYSTGRFDDVAPGTQHEDSQHQSQNIQPCESLAFFDPDRPDVQRHGDIGPLLNIDTSCYEDSVQIVADKMSDSEYRSLLQSLNRKQQEFFTHIMHSAKYKNEQVLCALHGGAGTGKSFVLKALYQGLYRLLCYTAGQNREDCRILVVAPTGKAAYNVKGSTIHSALHIPANNPLDDYKPLSHDLLNTYRMKYRHLQWVFCDEFSMASNNVLKYIHLRLQDIKYNKKPFGGVNIIAFGDLYQLQPVKDRFIFMDLKSNYGPLATNLWCENFDIYELDEIMRQKDDKMFAELLNRVRIGKHTTEDLKVLLTRKVSSTEMQHLSGIPHFFPTRKMVNDYNKTVLENSCEVRMNVKAIDILPSDISKEFKEQLLTAVSKRKQENTGGLPSEITVAVNHQYDIISNIAVEDGLMNGSECCIKYIQPQQGNESFPAAIWVMFENTEIGQEQRRKYKYLFKMNKVQPNWTPIFAHKRSFIVKSVWVTRVQFPLRHAAARTIHVAQSATYQQIYIDMLPNTKPPKFWWQHMHYVALSRVTSLSGLHIGELNPENICISSDVCKYLEQAKVQNSLKLSYTPLYSVTGDNLKVLYNNARSLKLHFSDVKSNYNILAADIIIISETRLQSSDITDDYTIINYNTYRLDGQTTCHGLMLYVRQSIKIHDISKFAGQRVEAIKIIVSKHNMKFVVVGLYKSPKASMIELINFMENILHNYCHHLPLTIIGDFNLNVVDGRNRTFCDMMRKRYNCNQCVTEPTTNNQTTIDLVFSNYPNQNTSVIDCYWSDHNLLYTVMDTTHH